MSLTDWIDKVADIWGEISDGERLVRSYCLYKKAEWPESLSIFPCALTRIKSVACDYSVSIAKDYYIGVTEFHLTPDAAKVKIPYCMLYYKRIRVKAAANLQLGGLVDNFMLISSEGGVAIEGPLEFTYGDEPPHWGLLVRWVCKEDVTSETTVSV